MLLMKFPSLILLPDLGVSVVGSALPYFNNWRSCSLWLLIRKGLILLCFSASLQKEAEINLAAITLRLLLRIAKIFPIFACSACLKDRFYQVKMLPYHTIGHVLSTCLPDSCIFQPLGPANFRTDIFCCWCGCCQLCTWSIYHPINPHVMQACLRNLSVVCVSWTCAVILSSTSMGWGLTYP